MSVNPLSRIDELFFLQVGSAGEISLDGFESIAMQHYAQRCLRGHQIYAFDSAGMPHGLVLTLGGSRVAGVRVRQSIPHLDLLLRGLSGVLQADFPGIAYEGRLNTVVSCRKREGMLYRLTVPRTPPGKTMTEYLSGLGLDDLMHRAASLLVTDSTYEDGDARKTLSHLHCRIRRAQQLYFFDYSIVTASLDPLPKEARKQAADVFALFAERFSWSAARRARISPFREAPHEE